MPAITAQQARTRDHPGTLPRPGRGWIPFRTVGGGPQSCALLAVMAAALAVVAPFFFLGTASGHDLEFHLSSWMDVARQWHEGVLYPRWAAWANYGFGEARFIFYPPASWLLGAALGSILPWKEVPGAFVWLALTLAGASMFRLAREWMPAGEAARAAVLYAVNPYHLVVVYFRSAYAELLASALFPLVVLNAVRIGRDPSPDAGRGAGNLPPRTLRRDMAGLALSFAAIWLCNAPAAVITSYSLVLVLAVVTVLRQSAKVLLAGGVAMALGLLLACIYIVPATAEPGWVNIDEVLSSGLRPEQNFLFTSIDDPERNLVNLILSTVATAQIAITGLAAAVSIHLRHPLLKKARELWWALLVLGGASAILMLPVSGLAWRALPKLRYVQFPWRWLLPLGVGFAIFVVAAIHQTHARRAWTMLMAGVLLAAAWYSGHQTWWDTQDAPVTQAAISQDRGYEGTDEYQTRGAGHYDLPQGAPLVALAPVEENENRMKRSSLGLVRVERWAPEEKIFTVEARKPVRAALRLLNYPAWQVEVNGEIEEAESHEDTGQMLFDLPEGHSRVRVRFTRTADRTLGAALTVLAAVVIAGLAWPWRQVKLLQPNSS